MKIMPYMYEEHDDYPTVMVNLTDALKAYISYGEDFLIDCENAKNFGLDRLSDAQVEETAQHVAHCKAVLFEIDHNFPQVWPA